MCRADYDDVESGDVGPSVSEMPAVEERVAYLEGRTAEHSSAISELRVDIRELRADMDRRFDQVDRRFDQVDAKFTWMIGFQFATLLALIGALLNVYLR